MNLRLSRLLDVADVPHAYPFALVQAAVAASWVLPSAVIPILALDRLGGAQEASVFFFAVSFVGLFGALVVPSMVDKFGRRTVFILGALLIAAAGVVFPIAGAIGLAAGMACYIFGFLCLDITYNVAMMERIPRKAFARFEPVRMMCVGAGFVIAPWLGVRLSLDVGTWATFAVMAALTVISAIFTFRYRLIEESGNQTTARRPSNPLRFVPRFARQPRLRLAWLLAFVRSCWWTMFFIYAPIYCVEYGLGEDMAGIILSVASVFMLLVPLWGRLGRRIGMRALLAIGYLGTGLLSAAVTPLADWPVMGVMLLLAAALAGSLIDAVGNALFLRAVHPHERAEMAAVFTTYRETAKIGAPGAFAVLLSVFSLPAVFLAGGLFAVAGAWYTRYVPKRY
ncbi:MAG: MFS transporter [Pseudomonadota bacterium]